MPSIHTDSLVSIIIPARNERFLYKTVKDILIKATGPIEVIIVLDGYWPEADEIIQDDRVHYLHYGKPHGMRNAINMAAKLAKGEYLLKCDAHVMFEQGFDFTLKANIPIYTGRVENNDDNWIVIPRRLRLDAENWCIQEADKHKPPIDYEYLSSPEGNGAKGNIWPERTLERMDNPDYEIDETPSFQGSCYFLSKNHYLNRLGGMSEEGYGNFVREAQEIGLKTWLSGGKVFINKKTNYAHLHKGSKYGRGYYIDKLKMIAGNEYCDDYWQNNRWEKGEGKRKYDLAWLIERFGGDKVPDWTKELIEKVREK